MTIYDFIELHNECHETVYTLFYCNKEDVVFMATDEAESTCEFSRDDLLWSDYADYEICSFDITIKNGRIHIEFNIEIDEEEF